MTKETTIKGWPQRDKIERKKKKKKKKAIENALKWHSLETNLVIYNYYNSI